MKIQDIDKNLKPETIQGLNDVIFLDVRKDPFDVYGLYDYKNEPVFRRVPPDVAKATNEGVAYLADDTAGGRVRFSTDSPYVAIRAAWDQATYFPHMTLCGTAGFDLYEHQDGRDRHVGTFDPDWDPIKSSKGYSSVVHVKSDRKIRNYTIHFPLYNHVKSLEIGISEASFIGKGTSYRDIPPVVYYGSSITQGGCASRPGNAYQNIISAHQNIDHINLGFSGSARGEEVMARYIASLDMSAFVLDYDHNAPSGEHLIATHEKFYRIVREAHPCIPIIIVTKPNSTNSADDIIRRDIIYRTFRNAFDAGDKNAYFIDGYSLFGDEYRDTCTVDTVHPNDLGFTLMAKSIGYQLELALGAKM